MSRIEEIERHRRRNIAQTIEDVRDDILTALHARVGVCNACGHPRCPDPAGTTLPATLSTKDVLDALDAGLRLWKDRQ